MQDVLRKGCLLDVSVNAECGADIVEYTKRSQDPILNAMFHSSTGADRRDMPDALIAPKISAYMQRGPRYQHPATVQTISLDIAGMLRMPWKPLDTYRYVKIFIEPAPAAKTSYGVRCWMCQILHEYTPDKPPFLRVVARSLPTCTFLAIASWIDRNQAPASLSHCGGELRDANLRARGGYPHTGVTPCVYFYKICKVF